MAYAYGTQVSKNYISSTAFLDKREILNKILDITNEEMSFLDIMELTNRSVPTKVPQYRHFVNTELYLLATAASSPAAAASINVTIDATAYAYANVGDLVLTQSGAVGYLFSKNGSNAVTLKSVNGANLTVVSTDKLAFFSNAAGEASLSPDARKWTPTAYVNQVQTFKAKYQITDIQKASQVEVEFGGKPYIMYKGQHESLIKFRGDIAAGLMFGQISATSAFTASNGLPTASPISGFPDGASATLTDAEGNPISTTMGLDQHATLYGVASTQATNGTSLLSEWATLTQTLNKLRAPQEYFLFVGTQQNIAFDNLFNNLGNAGITAGTGISGAARFMIEGKSLELGIDSVKLYGRTYHKKWLPLLDHQYIANYGATHKFGNSAYGVPAGKIKTNDGEVLDRLQVRYMSGDGTDLKYREIQLDGFAPTPTSERSVLSLHYQSTQGLQVLGANLLFKIS